MAFGEVEGETVVIILCDDADRLTPFSVIRLGVAGDRIVHIADCIKSPWVLEAAHSVTVGTA
jgi:hypothetical protein